MLYPCVRTYFPPHRPISTHADTVLVFWPYIRAYISPTYIYTCVHSARIWSLYPCMRTFFLPHQPISIHADMVLVFWTYIHCADRWSQNTLGPSKCADIWPPNSCGHNPQNLEFLDITFIGIIRGACIRAQSSKVKLNSTRRSCVVHK